MSTIVKAYLFLSLAVLNFIPQLCYSGPSSYVLRRTIHNNSGIPWIIIGQPCDTENKIVFDHTSNCTQGSIIDNTTCLLQPGYTTEVSYQFNRKVYNFPHCGKLILTDTSIFGLVTYRTGTYDFQHEKLLMNSFSDRIVISEEGNITLN